jgi:hypothetical protein
LFEGKATANVHEPDLQELVGGGDLPALAAHGAVLPGVFVQIAGHKGG